jgi:2-aminobenzoate-CoA ligase
VTASGDSAHVDTFARGRLPSRDLWPEFIFELPELRYPDRINCGVALLDDAVAEGHGSRVAVYSGSRNWTYAELLEHANRIANVLVEDLGIVPGNRVLLRAPNNSMLAACWLAVMKVGAIAVTTMPMLRAKELTVIADRAQIDHALCDARFAAELCVAADQGSRLRRIVTLAAVTSSRVCRKAPLPSGTWIHRWKTFACWLSHRARLEFRRRRCISIGTFSPCAKWSVDGC